jgi:hypothetical protein
VFPGKKAMTKAAASLDDHRLLASAENVTVEFVTVIKPDGAGALRQCLERPLANVAE